MTFTHALSTNNYGPAKFIVDASAANGTHTTIASALTSASSGDTIFIRPGTYTENLTLKAGVNLTAYGSEAIVSVIGSAAAAFTANVTILGTVTASFSGRVDISGILFQTNGAAAIDVTGASALLNLVNCTVYAQNATAITMSAGGLSLFFCTCRGGASQALFSNSGGQLDFANCSMVMGATAPASTTSSVDVGIRNSYTQNLILTTSSAGLFRIYNSTLQFSGQTCLTTAGTGTSVIYNSFLDSGSASAISVGTGTTVKIYQSTIGSSNTNAITGAGTIIYSSISSSDTSSTINTTTQTPNYTNLGKWRATGQPAFLGVLGSTDTNATGDATQFTLGSGNALTEIFDQGGDFNTNGTFTAPVTGKYQLNANVRIGALTALFTYGALEFTTSNRRFIFADVNIGIDRTVAVSADLHGLIATALADMDAADTSVLKITVGGSTKTASIVSSVAATTYSGCLIC